MTSPEIAPESPALGPDVVLDEDATAIERFIAEHVHPRFEQFRSAPHVIDHGQLIRRALQSRNVTVRDVGPENHLFTFGGIVIGGMDRSVTSLVSANARRIARHRWLTKQHLQKHEIPTPAGRVFGEKNSTEAAEHLVTLPGPGVLKPVTGRSGHGITTDLTTAEGLQQAWPEALEARLTTEVPSPRLLLEEFHEGLDLRAYVVGEELVSAVVRVPLHVVGDGRSAVRTLLERTLAPRRTHQHLATHIPDVQESDLEPMGLSLDTILDQGRLVILNQAANTRAGGIPVDVTDEISEDLTALAVDALWAIPELRVAAMDLRVPDLGTAEGAVVLHADVGANIVPHHHPAYGEPRQVAEAIAEEVLLTASR